MLYADFFVGLTDPRGVSKEETRISALGGTCRQLGNLEPKGGVYTPGVVFGGTDFLQRLQKNGLTFDVISTTKIRVFKDN